MRHALPLIALAALAACSSSESEPVPSATETAPTVIASAPSSAPAEARKVEIDNDLMDFEYSYPAQAAAIPALKAMLDSDLAEQQENTRKGTLSERESAKEGGYEARTYAHSTDWKVVTEIPGWLSLSADRYEFTGGAHGNPWFDAMLWDKGANVKRLPIALFTSKAALRDAIQPSVCAQVDKQRAEKRGEPVVRGDDGLFSDCIDPVESTIILGSSDKQHFDRVGVLIGPYTAGPYAEGGYEATVPVNAKVLAAVKPEYRKFFAVKR